MFFLAKITPYKLTRTKISRRRFLSREFGASRAVSVWTADPSGAPSMKNRFTVSRTGERVYCGAVLESKKEIPLYSVGHFRCACDP